MGNVKSDFHLLKGTEGNLKRRFGRKGKSNTPIWFYKTAVGLQGHSSKVSNYCQKPAPSLTETQNRPKRLDLAPTTTFQVYSEILNISGAANNSR